MPGGLSPVHRPRHSEADSPPRLPCQPASCDCFHADDERRPADDLAQTPRELVTRRPLGVIGVPTSAGAFAPGQEQAPAALRAAGLLDRLRDAGVEVRDHGDRETWRWRPDRGSPRAQNAGAVIDIVRDTARRVGEAIAAGETTLVFGGDCTVGIGAVAGHVASGERVGLVYFDTHADLNVPDSVPEGALDWMGMAHMLGEEGALAELVEAGPRLPPEQVVLFAWGHEQATPREREAIERLGLDVVAVEEVKADPVAAATRALELLAARADRVLVHFDVDVIDFTDTPLSENTGRNQGLSYADAARALDALLASPRFSGLTITELNPAHVEEGAGSVERLVADLARALGC
jgi:arginase